MPSPLILTLIVSFARIVPSFRSMLSCSFKLCSSFICTPTDSPGVGKISHFLLRALILFVKQHVEGHIAAINDNSCKALLEIFLLYRVNDLHCPDHLRFLN